MLVGMWMTRELVTVRRSDLLADVAQTMALRRIRHLPVVAGDDTAAQLVGIVSATDVVHAAPLSVDPFSAAGADVLADGAARALTVADVMTPNLLTTTPDAPIESAAAAMREKKIGALPVLRNGSLVGLITESDILRAFTDIFAVHGAAARITFDVSDGEDVAPLVAELAGKHGLRLMSLVTLAARDRPCCVIRVAGQSTDALLEDLWRSRHRVESVIRSST